MERRYHTRKSWMVPTTLAWTKRWIVMVVTEGKNAEEKVEEEDECISLGHAEIEVLVLSKCRRPVSAA